MDMLQSIHQGSRKRGRAFTGRLLPVALLVLLCGACATMPPPVPRDVATCFYDFTDVIEKRIYGVLQDAPGAQAVRRLWDACDDAACLCYEVVYTRPIDELAAWLREELPPTKVVPFRLVPVSDTRLEVVFKGGFE